MTLFSNLNGSNTNGLHFTFNGHYLQAYDYGTGAELNIITSAVYRDVAAWYHVVLVFDSTQATAANRAKIYLNGIQQSLNSPSYPSLNADGLCNTAQLHAIGRQGNNNFNYFDGYLADIHFCDGTAYDASAFGEFDDNGIWQPKKFAGVYGTNGFKLNFSDNSTAAALGTDSSGRGNTWTVNNISVAAGAGNDSLVDVPTNGSEVDTGSGGQVRGNYCTLNPLANPGSSTLSNGNLDVVTASASYGKVNGTIAVSSGKWYWEVVCTVRNQDTFIGIEGVANANTDTYTGGSATGTGWYNGGTIYSNASTSSYGTTYAANDVIGVALDMDAGTLVFYKNGVSAGTAKTGLSGSYTASVSDGATSGSGNTYVVNFGQRSWAYQAPSGFKALCTANLPAPVVTKPNTVMDVALYTGTGSSLTVSSLGFSPDLVWLKSRGAARNHRLTDTVRGATIALQSDLTSAEVTEANGLTAFNSNGFTVGSSYSVSSEAWVGWCWDAGSSTVTNTQGSITSQVRANPSAGFSIVTYTGNGTNGATVGHGLGVAPEFFIFKQRSVSGNWIVVHKSIPYPWNNYSLRLNTTDAVNGTQGTFGNVAPTSSVITLWASSGTPTTNANTETYVAYCFAPVAGYSAFGSYTGNGSADGPFVYTGFRPRWILLKSSTQGVSWIIYDTARNTYNLVNSTLSPNLSSAESAPGVSGGIDILSNGFKLRSSDQWLNFNAATYIYAAFAESPFQYARAR